MARLESLKALVAQSPADSRLRFMLGMELANAGDPQAALAEFNAAVRLDPDAVSSYFQAGRVAEGNGDVEAARAYYTRGIEAARRTGDRHADSEITAALDLLADA